MGWKELVLFIKKNNIDKIAVYPYASQGKQIEAALLDIYPGISIIRFDRTGNGINVLKVDAAEKYKD